MSNRRGIMSAGLKWEIAQELGVADIVSREGFGGVPSRLCGQMVTKAIELAERSLVQKQ